MDNNENNKKRKAADDAPAVVATPTVPLTKSQRKKQAKIRRMEEERMKASVATNQGMGAMAEKKRAAASAPVVVDDAARQLTKQEKKQIRKQQQREEEKQRKEEARKIAIKQFEEKCLGLRNNTQKEINRGFSEDEAKAIGLALVGNTSLEKMIFHMNSLKLPGVQALFNGIKQSQLKELWVCGNIKDAEIRQCLYQALEATSSLKILSVSLYDDDPLDHDDIISLSQVLMNNSNIRELSFHVGSNLTEAGAEALSLGLRQHTQLQKLEVKCGDNGSSRWLSQKYSKIAFHTLFEAIQHQMQSLSVLTLSEFSSKLPFHCIANGLQTTTSLKELVLMNGYLDVDAIRALAPGLIQNRSVTILRLVGDGIRDDGMIELASHFNHDSCLEEIHLDAETDGPMNEFGPRGVESLIRAVTNMPAMKTLDLSSNDSIGYPGWKIVGDALPNLTLHELDLRFDPEVEDEDEDYGEEGTDWCKSAKRALLRGIRENESVWKLLVHDGAYKRRELYDKMYFYTDRNLWGKRLLTTDHRLPSTIWCHILERCQKGNPTEVHHDSKNGPSLIYYILREQPHLVQASHTQVPDL